MKAQKGLESDGQLIMIIDDESYNCEVLKSILILIDPGLETRLIVCLSATEALAKVKESADGGLNIGLIFTDLSMPMMDGYQFSVACRRMLRNDYGIERADQPKIVALTGHIESEFYL